MCHELINTNFPTLRTYCVLPVLAPNFLSHLHAQFNRPLIRQNTLHPSHYAAYSMTFKDGRSFQITVGDVS